MIDLVKNVYWPGMQQLPRQSRPQPVACSSSWLKETRVATRLIVSMIFCFSCCGWSVVPRSSSSFSSPKSKDSTNAALLEELLEVCVLIVITLEMRERGGSSTYASACKSREVWWTAALRRQGAATTVQTVGADQAGVGAAVASDLRVGVTHT